MQGGRSHVILIHGLAAHRIVMQRLAWMLLRSGFRVENWRYRSVRSSLPKLGRDLSRHLNSLDHDSAIDEIHLVTHSMGSIVARCAVTEYGGGKLRRWVMLAPPNRGSHAARWLSPWLGWFCEPLKQLSDASDSFVNCLPPPPPLEIGILVAALDHVVRRSSTELENQADWLVMPGPHGLLPWRADAGSQVLHFLEQGRFHRPTRVSTETPPLRSR